MPGGREDLRRSRRGKGQLDQGSSAPHAGIFKDSELMFHPAPPLSLASHYAASALLLPPRSWSRNIGFVGHLRLRLSYTTLEAYELCCCTACVRWVPVHRGCASSFCSAAACRPTSEPSAWAGLQQPQQFPVSSHAAGTPAARRASDLTPGGGVRGEPHRAGYIPRRVLVSSEPALE